MRGWMFSEPGWEMTPTAVSPFFISEASRVPTAWPDINSSWPM